MVSAEITQLDRPEHAEQRKIAERLLEIYTPVRHPGTGTILAVLEYYESVTELEREIRNARAQSWAIVAALLIVVYLSLVLLVSRGSRTIVRQRDNLARQVRDYQHIVDRNVELGKRLRSAADKTTALNEQYLRRVAAELHDGPAQQIAYALLKPIDSETGESKNSNDILRRALEDIRDISAGLRSPNLDSISLESTVRRAVRDHGNRSGGSVSINCSNLPSAVSIGTKITVFRDKALYQRWRSSQTWS